MDAEFAQTPELKCDGRAWFHGHHDEQWTAAVNPMSPGVRRSLEGINGNSLEYEAISITVIRRSRGMANIEQGNHPLRRWAMDVAAIALMAMASSRCAADPIPTWDGYAGDPQHTALSSVPSLSLSGGIRWSTTIDYDQPNGGVGDLYIHYGSPLVTAANTVIVPVKTGVDSFSVEGLNGRPLASEYWSATTDYRYPPSNPTHGIQAIRR